MDKICGNCEWHKHNKEGLWVCKKKDNEKKDQETSYRDSCMDFQQRRFIRRKQV